MQRSTVPAGPSLPPPRAQLSAEQVQCEMLTPYTCNCSKNSHWIPGIELLTNIEHILYFVFWWDIYSKKNKKKVRLFNVSSVSDLFPTRRMVSVLES